MSPRMSSSFTAALAPASRTVAAARFFASFLARVSASSMSRTSTAFTVSFMFPC